MSADPEKRERPDFPALVGGITLAFVLATYLCVLILLTRSCG